MSVDGCPLCRRDGENALWHDKRLRVILVGDADYPGFCRVVWNAHVAETTDLGIRERKYLMAVVLAVEQALRDVLRPHKMNLASLGNQVPHLHWHVVPRFQDDAHFPDPVWAPRQRAGAAHTVDQKRLMGRLIELLPQPMA